MQNFMRKYQLQHERIKKYYFSGKNRLFRRLLESSGCKNLFYRQKHHVWSWVLLSITFMCEKTKRYKEKVHWKSAKTAISGIFPAFLARKIFFSKIGLCHILDIAILHQCAKFHEKISTTARENQEIPFFRQKLAVPAIMDKCIMFDSGFRYQ